MLINSRFIPLPPRLGFLFLLCTFSLSSAAFKDRFLGLIPPNQLSSRLGQDSRVLSCFYLSLPVTILLPTPYDQDTKINHQAKSSKESCKIIENTKYIYKFKYIFSLWLSNEAIEMSIPAEPGHRGRPIATLMIY